MERLDKRFGLYAEMVKGWEFTVRRWGYQDFNVIKGQTGMGNYKVRWPRLGQWKWRK